MPDCFFEDMTIGDVRSYGQTVVDRDEMVAFARLYDPQPFHIDATAAKSSFNGQLIASGWFVACQHMKMLTDDTLPNPGIMGAPGIDELKWLKPVVAGDVLSGRRTVLDKRLSASKPDRGVVQTLFEVLDKDGNAVMSQKTWEMFAARHRLPVPAETQRPAQVKAPVDPAARPAGPLVEKLVFFEDVVPGAVMVLGEKHFSGDDIIAFAKAYDPQTFHIDREAARTSQFGGLIASGWQTGCNFMGCLARRREAMSAAALARGEQAPRLGPSPGIRDLKWLKPTREGDTIRYYSQIMEKRPSASRPEWGIVTSQGSGWNQHGELVFQLTAAVFWERRLP